MSDIKFINKNTIKENGEIFKLCPSNGGQGACPYWVYFEEVDEYFCWKEQYDKCISDEEY